MQEVLLLHANLSHVRFMDCRISRGSFEDARIEGCLFSGTALPATHFLGASIAGSRMENANLQDTAFLGTQAGFDMDPASQQTARMSRPTTATLVFPEQRGDSVPRVGTKIADVAGTIPLRIAMQAPGVRADDVDREVERFLASRRHGTADLRPLAQQLVSAILEQPEDYPSASLILDKARVLAGHVDSVVLPGGEDVSPYLYGSTPAPETDWKGDYRRSLLELGLIHQCFNKGIPLMAICRGFQMMSIYFGAQLHQHVGPQVGVRVLAEEGPRSPAHGLFGHALHRIRSAVFHHQAVPAGAATAHLQPVLTRSVSAPLLTQCDVVMAAESSAQMAPLIGVQFHPEFFDSGSPRDGSASITEAMLERLASTYVDPATNTPGMTHPAHMIASGILDHMSPGNDALWKILADAAQAHRCKARIGPEVLAGGRAALKPSPVKALASSPASAGGAHPSTLFPTSAAEAHPSTLFPTSAAEAHPSTPFPTSAAEAHPSTPSPASAGEGRGEGGLLVSTPAS
jgi:putative glutamine amidotransferase